MEDENACLTAFIEAKEELRELISISAIKASHEKDLLERLDGLLDSARLLNSAWSLKAEGLRETAEELRAKNKELEERLGGNKRDAEDVATENIRLKHELAALKQRLNEHAVWADERVRTAVEREREASEAWKATLLKEAKSMIEKSISEERKRVSDAHTAGMDAVLQAAEKEESSRLAAVQETLKKAEHARQQAVKKTTEALERQQRAELEAASLQRRVSTLEHDTQSLRAELSVSLGKIAEEQERNKQLTHLLALSRQGYEEFKRVVEQRHAASLQAKDASLDSQLESFKAKMNKEVEEMRQRCEGIIKDRDLKVIEWRSRYFETVRKLEESQSNFDRLTRDLGRLGFGGGGGASAPPSTAIAAPAPPTAAAGGSAGGALISGSLAPSPASLSSLLSPASASFVSP
jgi:hypothetical protein